MIPRPCAQCGVVFGVKPSRLSERRFCSGKCRGLAQRTRIEVPCRDCGKVRLLAPDKPNPRCSRCYTSGLRGENNPNWKGGITPEHRRIRASEQYAAWRTAVFQRDGYACVACGKRGYIEADHIKPFSTHPDLRFDVANGRTLCKRCHSMTDTYLGQARAVVRYGVLEALGERTDLWVTRGLDPDRSNIDGMLLGGRYLAIHAVPAAPGRDRVPRKVRSFLRTISEFGGVALLVHSAEDAVVGVERALAHRRAA